MSSIYIVRKGQNFDDRIWHSLNMHITIYYRIIEERKIRNKRSIFFIILIKK